MLQYLDLLLHLLLHECEFFGLCARLCLYLSCAHLRFLQRVLLMKSWRDDDFFHYLLHRVVCRGSECSTIDRCIQGWMIGLHFRNICTAVC